MVHELEIVDGVAKMAFVGETPWHGLGVELKPGATPEEMLKAAALDWSVEKRPMFVRTKDGNFKVVQDKVALVRSTDDRTLTITGPDWEPTQNQEAFDFFKEFCDAGDMSMETAGSLREGSIVWGLASIRAGFTLAGGDEVRGYMLFTNPHRCGMSRSVSFTPIRVVCNNTLTMALNIDASGRVQRKTNIYSSTHVSKFDAELAKTSLGLAKNMLAGFKEKAEFLSSKRHTKESLSAYLAELFPAAYTTDSDEPDVGRRYHDVMALMDTQPGAELGRGTWWQPINAVTHFFDYKVGRKADVRLSNAWFGGARGKKLEALDLAVEYAEVA